VALAGDHWGVAMKAELLDGLRAAGHEPIDLGADDTTPTRPTRASSTTT
jgi:ribose 5-phosphate isomerase RpiB